MPTSQVSYLTSPSETTFDYESDPVVAMTSYAKMMHLHTKQQMDAATQNCRRRSAGSSVVDPNARIPEKKLAMSKQSQEQNRNTDEKVLLERAGTRERMDRMMDDM